MNVWPVLVRELRAEARRPMNYWLRALGASGSLIVFALMMWHQLATASVLGARLFAALHGVTFLSIWVLVPLLPADCLSRERREGTLGLLFLTPLKPGGIVAGKSLVHALRATTLLLTVLPILTLPFLLGGVSWQDTVMVLVLNCSALVLSLTAGLLASALTKDRVRSLLLALGINAVFAVAFMTAHLYAFYCLLPVPPRMTFVTGQYLWHWLWHLPLNQFLNLIVAFSSNPQAEIWSPILPGTFRWNTIWISYAPKVQHTWIGAAVGLLLLSLLALACVMILAAIRVRRSWKDEPPSPRRIWLQEAFCVPRFGQSFLRRRLNLALARNPIGWLHRYSWSARLTQWGWGLAVLVIECILVTDPRLSNLWTGQQFLAFLLMLSLAFSASGSFRKEKETGAMELLLVTPLKEWQLINGRVRGIWRQFLPAALILAMAWLQLSRDAQLFSSLTGDNAGVWSRTVFPCLFGAGFLTLPVVGLCLSMFITGFIASWILTCLAGLLLPLVIFLFFMASHDPGHGLRAMLTFQLVVGLAAWIFLQMNLVRRRFVLTKA